MKKDAMFYENKGDYVQCSLCPHICKISEGNKGICGVRAVFNGELKTLNYGEISSIALDPIEKKPLYHFKPGSIILSAGGFGCNLSCGFCQNASISKNTPTTEYVSPEVLVNIAKEKMNNGNIGIAFTYNEPSIWYEYIYDVLSIKEDMDIVLVSNGYIEKEALERILPHISAMNIDLKSFQNGFYKNVCGGDVDSVLRTIETAYGKCHIEITTLLINRYNDSQEEINNIAKWISSIDRKIPLHISRYYPAYKFNIPPTPVEKIKSAEEIAKEYLDYVYVGNVSEVSNNTLCPRCGNVLIERNGYSLVKNFDGTVCPKCGREIDIVF